MNEFADYRDDDQHVYAELIAYDRVFEVIHNQESLLLSHMFQEVYRIALGEPVQQTYSLQNDRDLIADAIAWEAEIARQN